MGELTQFAAGYPLSFVFWERISREYGRDLPKRFLAQLQKKTEVTMSRVFTPALHELEGMPSALLWYFVIASTVAKSCNCRVWAHQRVDLT